MPISESQLETWSNQGAVNSAKDTHESIRNALQSSQALRPRDFEVYLQGSYKNTTNIRGDSDVDVVVQLNSTFYSDITALSASAASLYRQTFPSADYTWSHFRADVLAALQAYYGSSNVTEGNKSLKIKAGAGRLAADVVVCLQYRRYQQFWGAATPFVEGILFFTRRENRPVINYPKLHYENGVTKND